MPQEHGKDESQRRAFPPLIPLLCKDGDFFRRGKSREVESP